MIFYPALKRQTDIERGGHSLGRRQNMSGVCFQIMPQLGFRSALSICIDDSAVCARFISRKNQTFFWGEE